MALTAEDVYAILKKQIQSGGGTPGPAGVGIQKIEKTDTEGLVDTYTIIYTDGSATTFTIRNGANGITPTIGDNENWFLGNEDTGKPSRGKNATDEQVYNALKEYIEGLNYDFLTESNQFNNKAIISPTAYGNALIEQIEGDTWQQESNGYQLFDASRVSTATAAGATVTNNGDGSFTVSGSGNLSKNFYMSILTDIQLKAGNLTLKYENVIQPHMEVEFFDEGNKKIKAITLSDALSASVTITDEEAKIIKTVNYIIYGGVGTAIKGGTIKPMLYQNGDGTWEPFTGGQPAPSPEYPQHIYGLGDTGYFDGVLQQGYYDLSDGGYNNSQGYVCNVNKIPCTQSDVVSLDIELSGTSNNAIFFYDKDGMYLSYVLGTSANAPADAYYFNFRIRKTGITPQTAGHIAVLINNKYAIKLETRGKNLFDYRLFPTYSTGGATVTNNGDGSFTITGSGNLTQPYDMHYQYTKEESLKLISKPGTYKLNDDFNMSIRPSFVWGLYNKNGVGVEGKRIYTGNGYSSFEVTSEDIEKLSSGEYMLITFFYDGVGAPIINGTVKPCVYIDGNEESIIYQENKTNLPISSPLYKGDQIVKIGSEYKVRRVNGVAVFDGSADEVWGYSGGDKPARFSITVSDVLSAYYTIERGTCNCLTYNPNVYTDMNNERGYIFSNKILFLRLGIETINSVQLFKEWLQNNTIVLIYPLEAPVYEEIPQEPFYNLMAADELTNVSLLGENENLELNNKVRFPRHTDGAIATTGFAEAKKNSILLEEQTQTLEQRVQALEALIAESE